MLLPPSIRGSMHGTPNSSERSSPSHSPGLAIRPQLPNRAPQGMTWLKRRENDLEQQLHGLLDAQSDALLAGIGGAPERERPFDRTSPSRKPKPQHLLSVRRSIYKTIKDLTTVKAEEESLLKASLSSTETTLLKLSSWDHKRLGLQREIGLIQNQDVGGTTRHLKIEADQLEHDIEEMEQKLVLMRQRYSHLRNQIDQVENAIQSKLSSYVTSLNMLDEEINAWLARPPTSAAGSTTDNTFYDLPKSRRTVNLAQDHWTEAHTSLSRQRKAVRRDRRALEQGALVWKEVATDISTFERSLQADMASSQYTGSTMTELLSKMDGVIASVEAKLDLATSKDWKLLIVCIAAELEAFKQGREILAAAAQQADSQDLPSQPAPSQDSELDAESDTQQSTDFGPSEYQSSHSHVVRSPEAPLSVRQSRLLRSPLKSPVSLPVQTDTDSDEEGDPGRLLIGG
jgi:hypothetical protein